MIKFESQSGNLILIYIPEMQSSSWVDEKLNREGTITFNRTFIVSRADLIEPDANEEDNYDERRFIIGTLDENYQIIRKRVLGLKHDLLISKSIPLHKQFFLAPRDVSIFRHINKLVSEQIVIGGNRTHAIPEDDFRKLLQEFPTSTELIKYVDTRIEQSLGEYLDTMSGAEQRLINYMAHRHSSSPVLKDKNNIPVRIANELEYEKYIFVKDQLKEMLEKPNAFHESYWQKQIANLFLLIFPQYIAVLENVSVKERYTNSSKDTHRKFDLVLVNANGCIDIIEIKKPFGNSLVSRGTYRDNYIPHRELSGAIMQAEKYLFYLNKGGRKVEQDIAFKFKHQLPEGLEITVASPKAIILNGRDFNLSQQQKIDLEFIRRKYSNVVDILSYDDLLRRLDNLIEALIKRK